MAKEKTCKGCSETFPLADFPNSATAKDDKLGYCSECWSERMSAARSKRSGESEKKNGKTNGNVIDLANAALSFAGSSLETIRVIADDGDEKTFTGKRARKQAYKQAMAWMLDGYKCILETEVKTVKRERFEFSLRTVGRR